MEGCNKNIKNMSVIKKVPLDIMINILTDLYEKGVNFVDIVGNDEDEITKMTITVQPDYVDENAELEELDDLGEEYEEDEDFLIRDYEYDEEEEDCQPLTDHDLNELI